MFQNIIQIVKSKLFFNDSKQRRIGFSCSNKTIALLRGITSNHRGDFYCLNYLHSFATENKRESHKKICEDKDFCNMVMPSEDTKNFEFNQYQTFDKAPFIIYANLESLIEKVIVCKNNPQNSYTTKVGKHNPPSLSMSRTSSLKTIKSEHDVYRDNDCIKNFVNPQESMLWR